ncbi:hypothetical protein MW722_003649 [Acinetobacter baumannii]|uniref:Uncharacterized protein n=40 Tax=Gammaproteobacteria TaxID=1236 RepID=U5QBF5_ACIBA|nr:MULTISPECIES: hypothetical protein [Acinetobacter]ETY66632.1 hypothetical protein X964_19705 [Acinetobacter baumannii MDR_MMC4]EXB10136.1 hypothetical protein J513_2761 [Acinetobacter baumannii 1397084]EXC93731.1 hypothetical protein J484_2792 [Acinetobacter baumannii 1051830]EXD23171.1 hypothetical protein J480_2709 [Acinetobacter baumannii 34654]EYD11399.1 hypothetical protein J935_1907 [Acinetobacter baumannii 44362_2]KCW34456.1 hypothetical protein J471_3701 [Acinetobacter baumannii 10
MNQDYIAFDPTLSMNLNGREVQFLLNPLDEKYVEDPAIFADYSYIKAGMLPPEEFEIRHALKMMILNENMLSRFSPLKKIFYKKDFQDVKIAAKYWREVLLNLMNKSPQHKAAIKRIASTITGDGIERLKPFLK